MVLQFYALRRALIAGFSLEQAMKIRITPAARGFGGGGMHFRGSAMHFGGGFAGPRISSGFVESRSGNGNLKALWSPGEPSLWQAGTSLPAQRPLRPAPGRAAPSQSGTMIFRGREKREISRLVSAAKRRHGRFFGLAPAPEFQRIGRLVVAEDIALPAERLVRSHEVASGRAFAMAFLSNMLMLA